MAIAMPICMLVKILQPKTHNARCGGASGSHAVGTDGVDNATGKSGEGYGITHRVVHCKICCCSDVDAGGSALRNEGSVTCSDCGKIVARKINAIHSMKLCMNSAYSINKNAPIHRDMGAIGWRYLRRFSAL